MAKGFLYLVVVMDWVSRAVLAWRLSNTLGAEFCVEALEEALSNYGRPEIFNTDQGSQFTSDEFTDTLKRHGITISMDGKGRCMDNIFVEPVYGPRGSTVVRSARYGPRGRRMSYSSLRQPPRNGRAFVHAFAVGPRRHREAPRGAELQRR
jgi:transposase InsO family protein